jgi:ribosomal protein S20
LIPEFTAHCQHRIGPQAGAPIRTPPPAQCGAAPELRSAVRNTRKAIAAGDKQGALTVFRQASGVIDSIADKRIIHKNTAARHKSRLAARIKAMS